MRVLPVEATRAWPGRHIFVCRARGEVFLTDDDLANFEKHQGVSRLGRCGRPRRILRARARRKHAGHPQPRRVQSRRRCLAACFRTETKLRRIPVRLPNWWRSARTWKRAGACAVLLAIPAGAFAYLRPLLPQLPIALAIREEAGQLVIGWNAGALAEGSRLEIQDGSERTILMLPANASSATYGGRAMTSRCVFRQHPDGRRPLGSGTIRQLKLPARPQNRVRSQDEDRRIDTRSQELRRSLAAGQTRTTESCGPTGRETGGSYTRTVKAFSARCTGL